MGVTPPSVTCGPKFPSEPDTDINNNKRQLSLAHPPTDTPSLTHAPYRTALSPRSISDRRPCSFASLAAHSSTQPFVTRHGQHTPPLPPSTATRHKHTNTLRHRQQRTDAASQPRSHTHTAPRPHSPATPQQRTTRLHASMPPNANSCQLTTRHNHPTNPPNASHTFDPHIPTPHQRRRHHSVHRYKSCHDRQETRTDLPRGNKQTD
mmetsp:Transcript_8819/g.28147  ORF Transcript_8819/g.28147 Transcript_8819/m.28147 type:complete len:207 (+) Transcript_8819:1560-2180(+)